MEKAPWSAFYLFDMMLQYITTVLQSLTTSEKLKQKNLKKKNTLSINAKGMSLSAWKSSAF